MDLSQKIFFVTLQSLLLTSQKNNPIKLFWHSLSGVYTGEKTLHIVAVASGGNLKTWENFY
jgi:hypothetical protein